MHSKTCEICGLKAGRSNDQKRTFMAKFPLDEVRCKQWVKVTGKEDLAYMPIEKLHQLKYICGHHFRPRDFSKSKNRLRKNAVPSLQINSNPLSEEVLSEFPLHIAGKLAPQMGRNQNKSNSEMGHDYSRTKSYRPTPRDNGPDSKTSKKYHIDHSYSLPIEQSSFENIDAVKPTLPVEEQNNSMDWVDLTKECPVPTLDLEVNDEKLNGSIRTQPNKHDVKMEEEDVSFYEDDADADKENTDQDNLVHAGLKCNVCQNEIIGFRYVCVQCVDWDMCSECEARAEHSHHYVLRIPAPRPQAEIQKVLQCIRHELSELHDNIQYCETVKEEVVCDTVQEQDLSDSDPLQLFNNDNQTLPYETQIPDLEEIPTQHTFHKTKSKPSIKVNAPSQLDHDKDKEEISYYETREILKLKVPLDVNTETLQKSLNKKLLVNLKRLSPSNICVDGILYKSADLYEDIEELT